LRLERNGGGPDQCELAGLTCKGSWADAMGGRVRLRRVYALADELARPVAYEPPVPSDGTRRAAALIAELL
jgi:hypothetical protein